nr:unnamed protein product [Spirometra erinaceieuropaei]
MAMSFELLYGGTAFREDHINFDALPTTPLVASAPEFVPFSTYAVPCDPHSERDIADALRKLRNNKARRTDGVPAEIYKSCVEALAPWPHEVIEQAWRDRVVPDDWGSGILVLILKKEDKAARESRIRPNHAGFRVGGGFADQLFTLKRILEFRHSYQQPVAVCLVDFAPALDAVHRRQSANALASPTEADTDEPGASSWPEDE